MVGVETEGVGGIEEGWVSELVGALLARCVEAGDVTDCRVCDCDVTEAVGDCTTLWGDVVGCGAG